APQVRLAPRDESHTLIAPPERRRRSVLPWILGAAALCVVLACCGVTGVGLMGVGLFASRRGVERDDNGAVGGDRGEPNVVHDQPNEQRPPEVVPVPPELKAGPRLVKSFRIRTWRKENGNNGHRGILGKLARDVREKDSARFEIDLNERAHCYLI